MPDQPIKYNSQIEKDEHDDSANIGGKRVIVFGWNPSTLQYERIISSNGVITTAPTPDYTVEIDYNSGTNPVYVGMAFPGTSLGAASWQIKKITYDGNGNPIVIQYAGGTAAFNQVWNNRASLSYS